MAFTCRDGILDNDISIRRVALLNSIPQLFILDKSVCLGFNTVYMVPLALPNLKNELLNILHLNAISGISSCCERPIFALYPNWLRMNITNAVCSFEFLPGNLVLNVWFMRIYIPQSFKFNVVRFSLISSVQSVYGSLVSAFQYLATDGSSIPVRCGRL